MSPRKARPSPESTSTAGPRSKRRPGPSELEEEFEEGKRSSEAPTLPPPAVSGQPPPRPRGGITSAMRPKRRKTTPAAAVDEVTADLSKDPRRER